MALSVGVDIVDVDNVRRQLAHDPGTTGELFTESEVAFCRSHSHPDARLAACFAAKEAFLKAVGAGLRDGLRFREIEIINEGSGALRLVLHGTLQARYGDAVTDGCRVSSAFTDRVACAVVALDRKGS